MIANLAASVPDNVYVPPELSAMILLNVFAVVASPLSLSTVSVISPSEAEDLLIVVVATPTLASALNVPAANPVVSDTAAVIATAPPAPVPEKVTVRSVALPFTLVEAAPRSASAAAPFGSSRKGPITVASAPTAFAVTIKLVPLDVTPKPISAPTNAVFATVSSFPAR